MSKRNDLEQIEDLDPDRLLTGFSKTSLITFILVSLVIHVVLIGGTSVGFITKMMAGEPETEEAVAADESEDEATEGEGGDTETPAETADPETEPVAGTGEGTEAPAGGEEKPDPRIKNPQHIQGTTEKAPRVKGPGDDLGIGLDDIN